MKSWISVAFGAAAMALGVFGAATPAAARSDVGVYIGHGGAAISIGHRHRNRCHNYWYRRNHPYRCGYGRYYNERYYYNDYGYRYRNSHRNHRHHWRKHHRHHDHDRRRHRRHHDWD